MGGETHPIPSHGSKRRSNPIPWVKIFLQSVPWDGMGLSHPMRSPGLYALIYNGHLNKVFRFAPRVVLSWVFFFRFHAHYFNLLQYR